tara:strand:+ start:848 stop:1030 length:183 start_codon:yes stop_codon:yes gene_type:complete
MKETTEELKQHLKQLVDTYNKAVDTQKQCKEKIIAINAVIQDRELNNGNSNTVTSEITED